MPVWFWLPIVIIYFLLPIIAITTEKSDRTISRTIYLYWIIGWIAYTSIRISVDRFAAPPELAFFVVVGAALLVYQTWYYRLMVKRLRDAGQGKSLAYVAIIPTIDIFIAIYLLIAAPSPTRRA